MTAFDSAAADGFAFVINFADDAASIPVRLSRELLSLSNLDDLHSAASERASEREPRQRAALPSLDRPRGEFPSNDSLRRR